MMEEGLHQLGICPDFPNKLKPINVLMLESEKDHYSLLKEYLDIKGMESVIVSEAQLAIEALTK